MFSTRSVGSNLRNSIDSPSEDLSEPDLDSYRLRQQQQQHHLPQPQQAQQQPSLQSTQFVPTSLLRSAANSPTLTAFLPRKSSITVAPPISLGSSPSSTSLVADGTIASTTLTATTTPVTPIPPPVTTPTAATITRGPTGPTGTTPSNVSTPRRSSMSSVNSNPAPIPPMVIPSIPTSVPMLAPAPKAGHMRSFFDSPRNSFSRSYASSALRISRTLEDSDDDGCTSGALISSDSDSELERVAAVSGRRRRTAKARALLRFRQDTLEADDKVHFNFPGFSEAEGADRSMDSAMRDTSRERESSRGPSREPSRDPSRDPSIDRSREPSVSAEHTPKQAGIFFKKWNTRRSIVPKFKAFGKMADDMRIEMFPLDQELAHESLITTAIKDEEEIISGKKLASSVFATRNNPATAQQDNLKRFEVISKANEAWNKHRAVSPSVSSTASQTHKELSKQTRAKKRKNSVDDSDASTYGGSDSEYRTNAKRRLVSMGNSPVLAPSNGHQHGSRLVQNASEDMEMMTLR